VVYRRNPDPFPSFVAKNFDSILDSTDDAADLCSLDWLAPAFEEAGVTSLQAIDSAKRAALILGPRVRRLVAFHIARQERLTRLETLVEKERTI
jgi:hypothetical protein